MRGTVVYCDTSAHEPSESSDSLSTRMVIVNVNKRLVSADARAFVPNYLLSVDSNSKRIVEGLKPKRF